MSELESKQVEDVLLVSFAREKLLDEPVIQEVGQQLLAIASEVDQGQKLLLTFSNLA